MTELKFTILDVIAVVFFTSCFWGYLVFYLTFMRSSVFGGKPKKEAGVVVIQAVMTKEDFSGAPVRLPPITAAERERIEALFRAVLK